MMADDDGFFDGFPSCLEYCDDRIRKYSIDSNSPNQNYLSIYRTYIRWFDDNRLHYPIVHQEEAEKAIVHESSLTKRTSREGTVFVTQSNVELYMSTVLSLIPTSSMATLRRKISALTWFLQHVEDISASTIEYSDRINRSMNEQ